MMRAATPIMMFFTVALLVLVSGCNYQTYFSNPSVQPLNATHDQLVYQVVNEHRIKQTCVVDLVLDNGTDSVAFRSDPVCVDAKGTANASMVFPALDGRAQMNAELNCG